MLYLYLILAVIFLVIAHYFKVLRLKQFIEIYEKPNENNLIQALSLGYIINFFIPFRVGDLFRAWYAGRKMKNGISFSLTTIIIDRILDVFAVGLIFGVFYLLGYQSQAIVTSIIFYISISVFIILMLIINLKYSQFLKKIIMNVARIFNSNIELTLLKFSWYMITSFKDLLKNISKIKMCLNTAIMCLLYLLSYFFFTRSMNIYETKISFIDFFTTLFSKNSFDTSTGLLSFKNYFMIVYLLTPLLILIAISLISKKISKENNSVENKYLELLPQVNTHDKLIFLEGYFKAESREYFHNYIMLNRDISILQDYSAGSNATTMLCTRDNQIFFRKYSFGKDNEKLYEQIKWLTEHQKIIPVTKVTNIKKGTDYCSYDMPYFKDAIGCFNYIHSSSLTDSWKILLKVLNTMKNKLHTINTSYAKIKDIDSYIDTKVTANLKKIENGIYIKPVLKYDYLVINGKKYHNLKYFKKYLSKEFLHTVFSHDECSDIHGDFTIENIIVCPNDDKNNFYLIDPNGGNILNSPNLDYAKLLQSLHGGYEFLMNTKSVETNMNHINYLQTKSTVYEALYQKYAKYLNTNFDFEKVRSIYFHEIIHWLRLMPYKIEKNGKRSVLFYAGLIIILNEIIEKYGDIS